MNKALAVALVLLTSFVFSGIASAAPAHLTSAVVTFETTDDNKDHDTYVNVYIYDKNGATIAKKENMAYSGNDSTEFNDNSKINMDLSIDPAALLSNCVEIGFKVGAKGSGNDTWKFIPTITLYFTDGSKVTKKSNSIIRLESNDNYVEQSVQGNTRVIPGPNYADTAPVLVRAEIIFDTTTDNKDHDTAIYVYVTDHTKQLAWIENAATSGNNGSEFNDHSQMKLDLNFNSNTLKSDFDKADITVGSRATGNDKWNFNATAVFFFSDGSQITKKTLYERELNSRDSQYVSTDFNGPAIVKPTSPVPPNPFRVILGPVYDRIVALNTMNYSGSYLSLNFGCDSPSVEQVMNRSTLPIILAYGSQYPDPFSTSAIAPDQSVSSFAGNCANGSWKAIGPESGPATGNEYLFFIDVWWSCDQHCSQKSPISTTKTTKILALRTKNNHLVTVVNGGGLGGPNSGPAAVALHTDAVKPGPWETFTVQWIDSTHFALKTINGNYITAVNGGGIGGPNDSRSPIHTDAIQIGPWEKLKFNYNPSDRTITIQTPTGRYLTAVNGGGIGGADNTPIHTDARKLGPWETFTFEIIK